jgi:hypothetical protein
MYDFSEKHGVYLKNRQIIKAGVGMGLKGEFRAILRDKKGNALYDSGWNRNLITNNASWMYDSVNWYSWCTIGSDGTAPDVTNTSIGVFLASQVSSTNPMPSPDYPRPPVAPLYERYSIKKWRFDAGQGTGTIREFTLGSTNDGLNAFCRHVLPAPIPKDVDQSLDIFYRFTIYPDLTPRTGTVTIDGVLYDWETSFFDLDTFNYGIFARQDFNMTFSSNWRVYDGAKAGPLDSTPSGNSSGSAIFSFVGEGPWYRTRRFYMNLDYCNTATNQIKVATVPLQTYHKVQVQILDNATGTSGIPKDNTKEAYLDWTLWWSRYP